MAVSPFVGESSSSSATQVTVQPVSSSGAIENSKFKCGETVQFWKDFQRDGFASAQENAIELAAIAARFAQKGPDGIDFLARHVARSGYFITNALLGTAGSL